MAPKDTVDISVLVRPQALSWLWTDFFLAILPFSKILRTALGDIFALHPAQLRYMSMTFMISVEQ